MTTKMSLTTLIAALTMAAGGLAYAQATPPSSTAGAGCTATANAMKGGNLGGSPSDVACTTAGSKAAANTTTTAPTTVQAPAPMTSNTTTMSNSNTMSNGNTMAGSASMGAMATETPAPAARTRVARAARADRN